MTRTFASGADLPEKKLVHIEELARIACRLAACDADQRVTLERAGVVTFDGKMWRHPDFINRAEAAYHLLDD